MKSIGFQEHLYLKIIDTVLQIFVTFFSFKTPFYDKLFVAGHIRFSMLGASKGFLSEFFPSLTDNSCAVQIKNI